MRASRYSLTLFIRHSLFDSSSLRYFVQDNIKRDLLASLVPVDATVDRAWSRDFHLGELEPRTVLEAHGKNDTYPSKYYTRTRCRVCSLESNGTR